MFSPAKAIIAGAIALVVGATMLVAQPFGRQSSDPSTALETRSAGCSQPLVDPGDYDGINEVDGAAQAYRVIVPEGYAELAPLPLILHLAGALGDVDENDLRWRPYLGEVESLFVIAEMDHTSDTLLTLLDRVAAAYCVDARRVHVMGLGSSGSAAASLACTASDRIASVALANTMFRTLCESERPVPLMAATGDDDRALTSQSVRWWSELNGCHADPAVEDLGSGVRREVYQDCDADVSFADIQGIGHWIVLSECDEDVRLPLGARFCTTNEDFDFLDEAVHFFAEHPLPE